MNRERGGVLNDRGAILLLALVIISVLGLGALAVANLFFTTSRGATAHDQRERVVNALDIGLAGALANLSGSESGDCPGDLTVDADGQVPLIQVRVTCTGGDGTYDFTAIACDGTTRLNPGLRAEAESTDGLHVTQRELLSEPDGCG